MGFVNTNKNAKESTSARNAKTSLIAKASNTDKRHRKAFKKYSSGHCRFEIDCSYHHPQETTKKEEMELIEKVKKLEKTVYAEHGGTNYRNGRVQNNE